MAGSDTHPRWLPVTEKCSISTILQKIIFAENIILFSSVAYYPKCIASSSYIFSAKIIKSSLIVQDK